MWSASPLKKDEKNNLIEPFPPVEGRRCCCSCRWLVGWLVGGRAGWLLGCVRGWSFEEPKGMQQSSLRYEGSLEGSLSVLSGMVIAVRVHDPDYQHIWSFIFKAARKSPPSLLVKRRTFHVPSLGLGAEQHFRDFH